MTRREEGDGGPVFFEDAAAFRAWLARNAARASDLVVGFRKAGSGMPSLSWAESVEEALCFGWIDGVRKRIDEHSYQIRFTPRKAGSVWSTVNIAKARALVDRGRMRPAGLEAFARRSERRSGIYSYEQAGDPALEAEEAGDFKRNKAAWRYFGSAPPGYRRTMLHWVASAKRPATRARRLSQLIAACAAGTRILK